MSVLLWLWCFASVAVAGLPLTQVQMTATVDGPVAEVVVEQVFENDQDHGVDGIYLFPLHEGAAVDSVEFRIGDRVIRSRIDERQQARRDFERARQQGQTAVLTTQQRANVFRQDLANVPPGAEIVVRLHLVQPVPFEDGAYELLLPTHVAPRFATSPEEAVLPEVPVGTPGPGWIDDATIDLDVTLTTAVPLVEVWSPTHPLLVVEEGYRSWRWLAEVVPDRDVVLRWVPDGDQVHAGLVVQGDQAVVTVQPPRRTLPGRRIPREILWVVDRSCSMQGGPLDLAKVGIHRALDRMDGADRTRVLAFSDRIDNLGEAERVTPQVRREQQAFVRSLEADGGTWLLESVLAALETPRQPGHERIVVYLTDGLVDNDEELLERLAESIGDSRLYVFGVGPSPNRFLLGELARLGRGRAVYLREGEPAEVVLDRFLAMIDAPVLTDLHIDWGDWKVEEPWPREHPALHVGQPLHLHARILEHGTSPIEVSGRLGQGFWVQDVSPRVAGPGRALESAWARTKIASLTRRMRFSDTPEVERAEILRTSLQYQVLSEFTAFLAVDPQSRVARPEREPPDRQAPVRRIEGTSADQVLTKEYLEKIPTGRSYQSAVQGAARAGPNMGGAASNENTYMVDGATITDPVTGTFSRGFDEEEAMVSEVVVEDVSRGPVRVSCEACAWRPALSWWSTPLWAATRRPKGTTAAIATEGSLGSGPGQAAFGLGTFAGAPLVEEDLWATARVDHRQTRLADRVVRSDLGAATLAGSLGQHDLDMSVGVGRIGVAGSDKAQRGTLLDGSWRFGDSDSVALRGVHQQVSTADGERYLGTVLQADGGLFASFDGMRHTASAEVAWTALSWRRGALEDPSSALAGPVDVSASQLEVRVRDRIGLVGPLVVAASSSVALGGGRAPVSASLLVGRESHPGLAVFATHARGPMTAWSLAAGHDRVLPQRQELGARGLVGWGNWDFQAAVRGRRHTRIPTLDGTRTARTVLSARLGADLFTGKRAAVQAGYTFAHALREAEGTLVDDGELLGVAHLARLQASYRLLSERHALTLALTGVIAERPLGTVLPQPGSRDQGNVPQRRLGLRVSQRVPIKSMALVFHVELEHLDVLGPIPAGAAALPVFSPDRPLGPDAEGAWVGLGVTLRR